MGEPDEVIKGSYLPKIGKLVFRKLPSRETESFHHPDVYHIRIIKKKKQLPSQKFVLNFSHSIFSILLYFDRLYIKIKFFAKLKYFIETGRRIQQKYTLHLVVYENIKKYKKKQRYTTRERE